MMEAEMDDHLGYEKSERSGSDDHRNGYKEKTVNSNYGSVRIEGKRQIYRTYANNQIYCIIIQQSR